MESKRYINLNGTFYQKDAPVLGSSNRAFLYGDALFESMHANGTTVQFFDLHYKRLIDSSKILHFELPEYFSFDFMKNEIRRLIQKNRSFKGSRIRLSLFRDSGGLFTPSTNRCSYLIEQSELPFSNYRLNTKGLVIDIFDRIRKPFNILSGMKSANSLLFVLAGIYKKENNFDDCL
ncbi:MAG: aminotransferase class IV, partial [Bacteroidota bacterium]|nr:aminotransferase class IV [Bacteroidota bacterium]